MLRAITITLARTQPDPIDEHATSFVFHCSGCNKEFEIVTLDENMTIAYYESLKAGEPFIEPRCPTCIGPSMPIPRK